MENGKGKDKGKVEEIKKSRNVILMSLEVRYFNGLLVSARSLLMCCDRIAAGLSMYTERRRSGNEYVS
jgi:hypothetical protein